MRDPRVGRFLELALAGCDLPLQPIVHVEALEFSFQ